MKYSSIFHFQIGVKKEPFTRVSLYQKYRLIPLPPRDLGVDGGAHCADDCFRVVRPDHGRPGHDHVGTGLIEIH